MSNLSKTDLINAIVSKMGSNPLASKRNVDAVLAALAEVATGSLKKGEVVTVPGLVRLKTVKKPATKAREGVNPFTKARITIAAKPASTKVKASPMKSLKDAVA
jgi:nucleoid DNA-binding protein